MAKILVVDNSVADRIRILNALEPEGHNIQEESDGRKAIETVETLNPDCIITELILLGVDGFKVIRSLREMGCTVPIIVQTNMVRDSMRDTCLEAGANAFLRKPVHSQKLSQTVRDLLGGKSPSKADPVAAESDSRP